VSLFGQNLYVQLIDGEQVTFSIAEKPKVTFDNGAMTIQQKTFQLANVQNLSFVGKAPTNIVAMSDDNKFFVFPNPVEDQLHIVFPSNVSDLFKNNTIELFDMLGRRVYAKGISTMPNGSTITINMSPFQKGSYILRIGNHSLQIIKR